jgi:hypothetical protein
MKKFWLAVPLLSLLVHPAVAQEKEEKEDKEESRVENAGKVFKAILDAPDSFHRTSSIKPIASSSFPPS